MMAFPRGRLLTVRGGRRYVLAPDGWTALSVDVVPGAVPISREDAETWCTDEGWDLRVLDEMPPPDG